MDEQQEFFKLMRLAVADPFKKIVFMVEGEVNEPMNYVEVKITKLKTDKVYFYEGSHIVYDCHDMDLLMDELYGKEGWHDFNPEKVQKIYDELPWEEALVVYLDER